MDSERGVADGEASSMSEGLVENSVDSHRWYFRRCCLAFKAALVKALQCVQDFAFNKWASPRQKRQ